MTRRVLLLTPPMTQLNTPYPATAYLKGFLAQHAEAAAIDVVQADPAIELFTALFCREGLRQVTDAARTGGVDTDSVRNLLANAERYAGTVDAVVTFLQGRDPSLALRTALCGHGIRCDAQLSLDCGTCGNGIRESGEKCDGLDLTVDEVGVVPRSRCSRWAWR